MRPPTHIFMENLKGFIDGLTIDSCWFSKKWKVGENETMHEYIKR